MTQEEKQILLKELCARLPYYTMVLMGDGAIEPLISVNVDTYICNGLKGLPKPYLRPMSSMTEEEFKEYNNATDLDVADSSETLRANLAAKSRVRVSKWYHGTDWLNAHHFDFHNLINKGLAIDCTDLNIY